MAFDVLDLSDFISLLDMDMADVFLCSKSKFDVLCLANDWELDRLDSIWYVWFDGIDNWGITIVELLGLLFTLLIDKSVKIGIHF